MTQFPAFTASFAYSGDGFEAPLMLCSQTLEAQQVAHRSVIGDYTEQSRDAIGSAEW